jgi:hypothetical protein
MHEGQISKQPNPDQCELNVYEDDAEAMAAGKASGRLSGRAANARGRVGRHTGARPHMSADRRGRYMWGRFRVFRT